MYRRRTSAYTALSLFLAGLLMIVWAGSGAAAASAASPKVMVRAESTDVLELSCTDHATVGHGDKFCDAEGSSNLVLNFDRGLSGKLHGMQPGSRYVFGEVMHVTNIWNRQVDVFIRVEQEAGGNLHQVLSVDLTEPNGNIHREFFPPAPSRDGSDKTIPMKPGDIVTLGFGIGVPEDWAAHNGVTFHSEEDKYTLDGAVIVRVGIDSTPRDDPPHEDDYRPPGGDPPDKDVIIPPGRPGSGPEPTVDPDTTIIDQPPPWTGPLPFTGGNAWPYVVFGLVLMGTGVWLFARARPHIGEA